MAFCRWGPSSDVYMYYGGSGYYCSNCLLREDREELAAVFPSAEAAAEHLRQHRAAGHKVPPGTIRAVLADGGRM